MRRPESALPLLTSQATELLLLLLLLLAICSPLLSSLLLLTVLLLLVMLPLVFTNPRPRLRAAPPFPSATADSASQRRARPPSSRSSRPPHGCRSSCLLSGNPPRSSRSLAGRPLGTRCHDRRSPSVPQCSTTSRCGSVLWKCTRMSALRSQGCWRSSSRSAKMNVSSTWFGARSGALPCVSGCYQKCMCIVL